MALIVHTSIPELGRLPWRRKWPPTPVSLLGKFHGQRRLVGYSSQGHKDLDKTEWLTLIRFSVQSFNHVQLFETPWTAACQASLSITNSQSLLKFMSIESVMPSNHLILCRPLLPPSIFPSIRVFSNESVLWIRWPKCWSFSYSISPSNEYAGLTSFRIDWLDLLRMTIMMIKQGNTLKNSIYISHCSLFIFKNLGLPWWLRW